MNRIQRLSQKILSDRLKLELGLDLDAEIDYRILRAISPQLRNDRLLKLSRVEATYLSESKIQAV